jgi:DNA-binding GntR family transcriptional regulator
VLTRQKRAVAETDALAYYETNAELHRLIARHSGNPRLALMLGQLEAQMAIALQCITTSRVHMRAAYKEHGEILSHIRAKDGRKAEAAMRSHIAAALARVTNQYECGGRAPTGVLNFICDAASGLCFLRNF